MKRRSSPHAGVGRSLAIYAIWLALSALAAWTAWQLHVTLIYLATLWLQSELPRPAGWGLVRLSAISRVSVLVLGSLWLVGVMVMENLLRHSRGRAHLCRRTLQILLGLVGTLGLCYSLVFIAS